MSRISSLDSHSGRTMQKIPLIDAHMLWLEVRFEPRPMMKTNSHGTCYPEGIETLAEHVFCEEHWERDCRGS